MRESLAFCLVAVMAACGGTEPVPPTPAALAVVSGDSQSGQVGAFLSQPLVVRVTDPDGRPVPAATVIWNGPGELTATGEKTDEEGLASANWRLGTTAGEQTAVARVDGLADTVVLNAVASPGPVVVLGAAPSNVVLVAGWTRPLGAGGVDAFGNTVRNPSPVWTTSDPSVATVSDGAVVGVGPGAATLVATLGAASASLTVRVISAGSYAAVEAGYYHTCGLNQAGEAWCWGDNWRGQLGATNTTCTSSRAACSLVPVAVTGGLEFRHIVAGGGHTCALTASGVAYCWGDDRFGQLGAGGAREQCGTQAEACSHAPLAVSGGHTFVSLSAGDSQTCGLTTDLEAWCWGYNQAGRLGNGTTANQYVPMRVTSDRPFLEIQTGGTHSCAVTRGRRPLVLGLQPCRTARGRYHHEPQPAGRRCLDRAVHHGGRRRLGNMRERCDGWRALLLGLRRVVGRRRDTGGLRWVRVRAHPSAPCRPAGTGSGE